jgi:hypothetical protein
MPNTHLHTLNGLLRKIGLHPSFPGESSTMDSLKLPLADAYVTVQKLRGFETPPGF